MCTLGHLAAASPAVESRCVFLLVAHAARTSAVGEENSRGETRASVVAKAADILTRLARAMGYPTRREYVARHARVIGALWMRAGISARRLLAVPELVASLGDGDAIRLAKEWSRVLLPPAVLAANAGAVRALAEACGETRATILRENVARIFAQLFVLSRCETEPRRRLASAAAAALKGPLLAEAADGGSPDALYLRHLADVASEMTYSRILAEGRRSPPAPPPTTRRRSRSRRRITPPPRSSAPVARCRGWCVACLIDASPPETRARTRIGGRCGPATGRFDVCRICTPSRTRRRTRDTDSARSPASA